MESSQSSLSPQPFHSAPSRTSRTSQLTGSKGPWSVQEDADLATLVGQLGAKKWSAIACRLPGRIGKQCRERWHNHLNPSILKTPWSEHEDRVILESHASQVSTEMHKHCDAQAATPSSLIHAFKPHSLMPPLFKHIHAMSMHLSYVLYRATSGLRSPRCSPGEQTTPSRTTGTAA